MDVIDTIHDPVSVEVDECGEELTLALVQGDDYIYLDLFAADDLVEAIQSAAAQKKAELRAKITE